MGGQPSFTLRSRGWTWRRVAPRPHEGRYIRPGQRPAGVPSARPAFADRAAAAITPIPGSPGAATRTTAALAGATAVLACAAGHGRTRHASKGRKTTDPPEALEKRMQRSAGERWVSEHAAAAGLYMSRRHCPLTVPGCGHGSRFAPGGLRCDLERLYPKVSGTTRRCSLAMGTPGARRGLARC
jgi:hypothetical protein